MTAAPPQLVRVLVVEDSRAQRELLVGLLQAAGTFTVVGVAADGQEAVAQTLRLRPDVVAMDIQLPIMDGYEATRQIMQRCPTPIVMMSSATADSARRSVEALAVGAVAVIRKPGSPLSPEHATERAAFLRMLRLMSEVRVVTRHAVRPTGAARGAATAAATPQLVAIAASTGGPAAIQTVLSGLGPGFALPVLVVQHIARGFVVALAEWLGKTTAMPIHIAQADEPLLAGHVYLAPDDQHLVVARWATVGLRAAQAGDDFCPSGNTLFHSVAAVYGGRAIGVLLTGMGEDGARGLQALHGAGAWTVAQDEASSVVYGMPRVAAQLGAASMVLPVQAIAGAVLQRVAPPSPAPPC